MCGKKELFYVFDDSFRESVKLGNNSRMTVMGKGNIWMQVNELIQVIAGVFYAPDLKNNLLSIGQLQEKGINILIQHGKCKLYHPERGLIMETAMSKNRMFVLSAQTQIMEQACFNSFTDDPSRL